MEITDHKKDEVLINGQKLRALRKSVGVSLMEVSQKSGIKYHTLLRIEKVNKTLKNSQLEKISTALNIGVDDFYNKKIVQLKPAESTIKKKDAERKPKSDNKRIKILSVDVFKFNSVTHFIQTWFKKNKKEYGDRFHFRFIAKRLGCTSTSEIFKIINKKKLPSREMINRFIRLLDLSNKESIYLILLSQFTGKHTKRKLKKDLLTNYKELIKKK